MHKLLQKFLLCFTDVKKQQQAFACTFMYTCIIMLPKKMGTLAGPQYQTFSYSTESL